MKDKKNTVDYHNFFLRNKVVCLLAINNVLLGCLVSGCGETKYETKYIQCEQIFHIANGVVKDNKNVAYIKGEQPTELKSSLEVANRMNQAADNIQALGINDSKLIKYQNKLVTIYRIYSQATYDAAQARENKDIEALKSARIDAEKAGAMQNDLVREINAYCLVK